MALDLHRGGSGEPLVLIHGIGHTWRGWKPMLPLLEPHFDVLAMDLPGFGHSPSLPAGVQSTPETLAHAVEAAMDAAGFQTAHLAGNSLGGWISLELARRDRARTVTALSPAGLAFKREVDLGRAVLVAMRALARNLHIPDVAFRTVVGRTLLGSPLFGRPWRQAPDDLIEQTELLGNCSAFEATLTPTIQRQAAGLPDIRCPVLLLWGTLDLVLIPRQGRRFERLIPDCELRYLRGLGHVPMSDDPDLLADSIIDWAKRATPAQTAKPAEPAASFR